MKHTALILAVLIFAFSLVSCSDLNYYKGAGWDCSQEEFYANHYDTVGAQISDISNKYGINVVYGMDIYDDHFRWVVCDDKFTCFLNFYCEELWGRFTVDGYFYGDVEADLENYGLQEKYVNFMNEVTCLFAYNVEQDKNMFEETYNSCVEKHEKTFEKVFVNDYMTGGVFYGVSLGIEKDVQNHTLREEQFIPYKCNYYYYRGIIDGSFCDVHAEQ